MSAPARFLWRDQYLSAARQQTISADAAFFGLDVRSQLGSESGGAVWHDKPYSELGGLALDLLHGEEGASVKELRRLADFIKNDIKPDIVTLPNLMFMGTARVFHHELKIPVVCELTARTFFLTPLWSRSDRRPGMRSGSASWQSRGSWRPPTTTPTGWRSIWGLGARRLTWFIRDCRRNSFGVPARQPNRNGRAPTVGYLARICPEKGLAGWSTR